jgi:hypothetical protein
LLVKALGHIPWVVNVDPRAWSCSQRFHDWALFRTLHVSDDLLPVSVGNLQNNLREPWAGASAQPPALVTGAGIASETHSMRSLKSLPAASLCKAGHIALPIGLMLRAGSASNSTRLPATWARAHPLTWR